MWTGRLGERDIVAGLARLSDEDLRSWWRLSTSAMRTQLDGPRFPAPASDAALSAGLEHVAQRLPATQQERFWTVVEQGENASSVDGCFAMQAILLHADSMSERPRSQFLRSLAATQ
jgi:hypothetical protein